MADVSPHTVYILRSLSSNKIYIGYTIDFSRRIRQHNGEISNGAKKTMRNRPWKGVCIISGFLEASSALRFEYRLNKSKININNIATKINELILKGDGTKGNTIPWNISNVEWIN